MKKFLQKHLGEIFAGIIVLLLAVHFFLNFHLIQNPKLMEESRINLVNGIILIFSMTTGMIFTIRLLFIVYKKTARDLEGFILKNLTTACFLLILMLGFHGIAGNLDKNFTLTAIGAILVFWYGYKTYERDKEIQMIEKYSEKYNLAKGKLPKYSDPEKKDYTELLTIWYEEYFLFKKGYISSELWNEWEYWIKRDIASFLWEGEKVFSNKAPSGIANDATWVHCMDSSTFLNLICQDYVPNFKSQSIFLYKHEFSRYLIGLVNTEKDSISEYSSAKGWLHGMNELITILTKPQN